MSIEKMAEEIKESVKKINEQSILKIPILLPYGKAKEWFEKAYEVGLFGGDELDFNRYGDAEIRYDRDNDEWVKEDIIIIGTILSIVPQDKWQSMVAKYEDLRNIENRVSTIEELLKDL